MQESHDVWIKLENIYQSKGPARKATLLKQLTLRWRTGTISANTYEDSLTVDKLSEMDIQINPALLAVMLLQFAAELQEFPLRNRVVRRSPDARDIMHQNHRGKRCQKKRMRYGRGTRCANNRERKALEKGARLEDQSKRTEVQGKMLQVQ